MRACSGVAHGVLLALGFGAFMLLILLLAGCTMTFGLRTYVSGPATYITGEPSAVAAYCRAVPPGPNHHGAPTAQATGCARWTATTATIACPADRPACIAHELHHILDPTWDHR